MLLKIKQRQTEYVNRGAKNMEDDYTHRLEETINFSRLGIYIDIKITWSCGKAWDGLNISSQSVSTKSQ